MSLISSIPLSASDDLLRSWGYDLITEYAEMVHRTGFGADHPVIELATGSGRMTAVLAHMGFRVITGDRFQDQHQRVLDRLTHAHVVDVSFVSLDMSELPFADRSVRGLACVNTLHDLDEPQTALNEILRVMHPQGRILLADFNDQGFEVMQRLERTIYGRDHRRGTMPMAELAALLVSHNITFLQMEMPLNSVVLIPPRPFS